MNLIDPKVLRESVTIAYDRGHQESLKNELHRKAEAMSNRQKAVDKALVILRSILPKAMEEAALKREKCCVVMHMTYGDGYFPALAGNKLAPEQLDGAALIVWNECVKAKFNPQLQFWHDGVGIESGFDLVIPLPLANR